MHRRRPKLGITVMVRFPPGAPASLSAYQPLAQLCVEDGPQRRADFADGRPLVGVHPRQQFVQELRHAAVSTPICDGEDRPRAASRHRGREASTAPVAQATLFNALLQIGKRECCSERHNCCGIDNGSDVLLRAYTHVEGALFHDLVSVITME